MIPVPVPRLNISGKRFRFQFLDETQAESLGVSIRFQIFLPAAQRLGLTEVFVVVRGTFFKFTMGFG